MATPTRVIVCGKIMDATYESAYEDVDDGLPF